MISVLPLLGAAMSLAPMPDAASLDATGFDADRAAHQLVLATHAEGAQVYQCKAGADGSLLWSAREPIATLIAAGKTIGRHYAGPHWALDDGGVIQGKLVASAPGATSGDVPLLKLAAVANSGLGALAPATLVYRLHTHGGVMAGACTTPGMLQAVAYSADYIFAK